MRTCFKHFVLISCLTADGQGKAQNLVPNWSFEQISLCPHDEDQLEYAYGWGDYFVTPDLYNSCDGADTAGVPANWAGYQVPGNGVGYAGLIAYGAGGNGHEVIGAQFTSPLQVGVAYELSVRFSWTTGAVGTLTSIKYSSNNLGLMLRTQPLMDLEWLPWPNYAHVSSPDVISDSVEWTTVQGVIVADSAYQFVLVGNFFDDASTTVELTNPGGQFGFSYYYVDDVCVVPLGGECGLAANVHTTASSSSFVVHPVPFDEEIVIDGPLQGDISIQVLGALGAEVYRSEITGHQGPGVLHLPELASGPYILRVTDPQRELLRQLIVRR